MSIYQNLMQQIDNAGLLFNVQECNLYAERQELSLYGREGVIEVPNKKALINTSNGEVMSVVSSNYKVVTNEQIFDGFCKSIEVSGIDGDGATVNIKQTPTGSRAMVEFVFPQELLRVGTDQSTTALQLCALNSFDGTTRYVTKAGGLRMKCLNGQILGNIVGAYSSTHTKSLDVDAGAASVIKMVQEFNSASDYWGAMMQRHVGDITALNVIKEFLGVKEVQPDRHNARLERCMNLWGQYKGELGSNVYALYNVLKHYVSHPDKRYKNATQQATQQRTKVEKLLNTHNVFKVAA